MTRIHLVYPHGPAPAAPDVIGRRLAEHLEPRFDVRLHDWYGTEQIRPEPGAVLLGHPHPVPGTTFRRSFRQRGWSRRLVMSPFNGDPRQVAFLDPLVRAADAYLAITGRWWFDAVRSTGLAHWAPRMVHLDLAVDRAEFPRVKTRFADPGRRRVLYIGHSGWQKNVGYLAEIARARPGWEFSWMGAGAAEDIPGFRHLGRLDVAAAATRAVVAEHDLMLTVGRSDANPMSVLESMSWGLVPVCTPQSGYVDEPGIVNVPLDDLAGALAVLDHLQDAPPEHLVGLQQANDRRLDEHYTWARFGRQVETTLDLRLPPAAPVSALRRLRLASTAAASPSGPFRGPGPRLVARSVVAGLRRSPAGSPPRQH